MTGGPCHRVRPRRAGAGHGPLVPAPGRAGPRRRLLLVPRPGRRLPGPLPDAGRQRDNLPRDRRAAPGRAVRGRLRVPPGRREVAAMLPVVINPDGESRIVKIERGPVPPRLRHPRAGSLPGADAGGDATPPGGAAPGIPAADAGAAAGGGAVSAPDPCRPTPARSGLPVDEEEMRRWMRRLVALGYQESTARNWVSRIRIAYAHGVTDEAEVDAGFPSLHQREPVRHAGRDPAARRIPEVGVIVFSLSLSLSLVRSTVYTAKQPLCTLCTQFAEAVIGEN